MPKILVTGGGGFIGSNLTEALLKQGHQVRVFDNFLTGKRENLIFDKAYPDLEILEGDIRDVTLCHEAMKEIEYVFHQAALPSVQQSIEDPVTSNGVNVGGTLNLLLAARDASVKKWVYASSCAIYGDDPTLPKSEAMRQNSKSPYAFQKFVGEEYGKLFFQCYGLETVALRYFNVFGPKQDPHSLYSAVIPRFIDALIHDRSPVIDGDGEQSRDFIYIEDVIQANFLAMTAGLLPGEVINVASGKGTSINQLLHILKEITGSERSAIYQAPRQGDIRHSLADIQKGKRLLNYDPKVSMMTGLKKTVEFFKRQAMGEEKR
jgi:UDP-glucose 4-epimerase